MNEFWHSTGLWPRLERAVSAADGRARARGFFRDQTVVLRGLRARARSIVADPRREYRKSPDRCPIRNWAGVPRLRSLVPGVVRAVLVPGCGLGVRSFLESAARSRRVRPLQARPGPPATASLTWRSSRQTGRQSSAPGAVQERSIFAFSVSNSSRVSRPLSSRAASLVSSSTGEIVLARRG